MVMILKIKTPAKINPYLNINKKRQDGYHELFMHMVPISCYDEVIWEVDQSKPYSLHADGKLCGEASNNLVSRAVQLFSQKTQIPVFGTFRLIKNIPVGAGMGGGSGNAAGTLVLLNHYHQHPLSKDEHTSFWSSVKVGIRFWQCCSTRWKNYLLNCRTDRRLS